MLYALLALLTFCPSAFSTPQIPLSATSDVTSFVKFSWFYPGIVSNPHFCSPYQFVSVSIRTRHFVVYLKYVSDLLSTMSSWRARIVPYLFSFFSSVPGIGPGIGPGINQVVPMQRLHKERQDKAGLSPRRTWLVGNYTNRDLVICSKA